MDSKKKGNIGEIACMLYFETNGYTVLTPFGDRNRYDLVYEDNGVFLGCR